jgi:hypothetical protein
LAVKLDTIPGAGSTSRRGLSILWSKENEQWSSKAKAEKTMKHQERRRMFVGADSLLPATEIVAWFAPLLPFHGWPVVV